MLPEAIDFALFPLFPLSKLLPSGIFFDNFPNALGAFDGSGAVSMSSA